MDIEELLQKADFSKNSSAHKEALRKALFGKARKRGQTYELTGAYELTDEDLDQVTAAGKTWIDPEKKLPPD